MKTRIAAVALLVASLAGTADAGSGVAGLVIDFSQVGSDVVATGSGSLDLTGLSYVGAGSSAPSRMYSSVGVILIGPSGGGTVDVYSGASGPASFGLGGLTDSSSGTGDLAGVDGPAGVIFVPVGYVSGSPLSSSMTFDNTTIAGLGLTPGTYTFTWGPAQTDGSLTIGIASVPEPSSLAMAGMAVAAGLITARRRRP